MTAVLVENSSLGLRLQRRETSVRLEHAAHEAETERLQLKKSSSAGDPKRELVVYGLRLN